MSSTLGSEYDGSAFTTDDGTKVNNGDLNNDASFSVGASLIVHGILLGLLFTTSFNYQRRPAMVVNLETEDLYLSEEKIAIKGIEVKYKITKKREKRHLKRKKL